MKKIISTVLCLTMLMTVFSGCGNTASEKETAQSINLFIWSEYMPQEVLDDFEEEYGVKVNITLFSSIPDMYAKVKSSPPGTYDVIDSADFYIARMAKEGLIEKLNFDNIPNYSNIGDGYKNLRSDPNNEYSVPYLGGVATLCVNTSMVDEEITTYEDLFNPKYKNSIVMIEDYRVILGAMNLMQGFEYDEKDPEKLEMTKAKLMELKPNIKILDSDSPKSHMISGETAIGLMYSAEIAIAMDENPDIKAIYPPEGQYLFLDSLCVATGSKNKEMAEKFINYIHEPEVSKKIIEIFPYTTPNEEAAKLMDDSYVNNPAKNVPQEVIANGYHPDDVESDILQIYNDIWAEFTK